MKTQPHRIKIGRAAQSQQGAFSIVEIMVGMAVVGICFVSLYAGISSGVQVIQLARENLRATQVMVEKTETVRLYAWEQLISGTNVPCTFTETFYPAGLRSKGITYYGTVAIEATPFEANYAQDMRLVTVRVSWTNFNIPRYREMKTFVARNGMQNYVF